MMKRVWLSGLVYQLPDSRHPIKPLGGSIGPWSSNEPTFSQAMDRVSSLVALEPSQILSPQTSSRPYAGFDLWDGNICRPGCHWCIAMVRPSWVFQSFPALVTNWFMLPCRQWSIQLVSRNEVLETASFCRYRGSHLQVSGKPKESLLSPRLYF